VFSCRVVNSVAIDYYYFFIEIINSDSKTFWCFVLKYYTVQVNSIVYSLQRPDSGETANDKEEVLPLQDMDPGLGIKISLLDICCI
jgi:hypothetical protein